MLCVWSLYNDFIRLILFYSELVIFQVNLSYSSSNVILYDRNIWIVGKIRQKQNCALELDSRHFTWWALRYEIFKTMIMQSAAMDKIKWKYVIVFWRSVRLTSIRKDLAFKYRTANSLTSEQKTGGMKRLLQNNSLNFWSHTQPKCSELDYSN